MSPEPNSLSSDCVSSESVAIVGGGIIGIACAHYLNQRGYTVTVIDQNAIAAECSHGNCGYICPSHVLPLTEPEAFKVALKSLFQPNAPFRVKPSVGISQWKWFLRFAARCNETQMLRAGQHLKAILDSSMHLYRELMTEENIQCEWKESGLLYVFRGEHALREFAKGDDFLTKHFGVTAELIKGDELNDFDPALNKDLAGAYYYAGDASVRPDLLCASWTQILTERGVEFRPHCELKSIYREGSQIRALETSQGHINADRFVFSLGAKSPVFSQQLNCKLPVLPGKGFSVTMQRPELCPRYPMLFPEHKVGVSPFEQGYRLGSMMEFAGYDDSIPQQRIDQLRSSAEPYLINPHTDTELDRWYGWRPMTWDSLPIIGPISPESNAIVATGHNMLGLSLATATGKLVTELLSGDRPHLDVDPFSPARCQ